MGPAADADSADGHRSHDQLRHDLLTPVTVISARVGMIERIARRSASMTDAERARLLADAASIQAAVLAVCAVVDGMQDGPAGPGPLGRP